MMTAPLPLSPSRSPFYSLAHLLYRCIFELYHTVLAKSTFEIFFPADQRAKFVKALDGNKGLIKDVCARMDINKATAYDKDDEVRILKQVDDSGIGRRGLVSEGDGGGMPPSLRIGRHP